jgi:hypothetical protein
MTPVMIVPPMPPMPPIFHPDDARLFAQRCFESRSLKKRKNIAKAEKKGQRSKCETYDIRDVEY